MESVDAYKAADGWKDYKDYIVGYQPNNQICYTATAKVEITATNFGATQIDNKWDSATKKGVIIFDGDVTKIASKAFSNQTGLMSISLPETVTTIYGSSFKGCTSLTEITIPASVGNISTEAFSGCTMLSAVHCKPTTPPTLGTDVFKNNASDRKIYVPATDDDSVLIAYKGAEKWSAYATSIEEEQ
jgi:hypothetical protein